MKLENALQNYGLTEKQAKVYIACLTLGSASILKISRRASIPRSTTENILESLKEKGFVYTFKKKKTKYFSVEDPKKVLELEKTKTHQLEELLPEFNNLYNQSNIIPTVRLYNSKQGIKFVIEEIIEDATYHKQLYSFGLIEGLFDLLGEKYWNNFVKQRIRKKMKAHIILRESALAHNRKEKGVEELREVRMVSSKYAYSSSTFIWGNKIALFSLKDEINAVVIESTQLADVQKAFFQSLWDNLSD